MQMFMAEKKRPKFFSLRIFRTEPDGMFFLGSDLVGKMIEMLDSPILLNHLPG